MLDGLGRCFCQLPKQDFHRMARGQFTIRKQAFRRRRHRIPGDFR